MNVAFLGPTPVKNIIEAVLTRPRMYTILGSPAECICFLSGYISGRATHDTSNELWAGFSGWLREHLRHLSEGFQQNTWNEFIAIHGNDEQSLDVFRDLYIKYTIEAFGEQYIKEIQQAAKEGKTIREILLLLRRCLQPSWSFELPVVLFEHFLMRAFQIPLRTAREIECWKGFSENGTLDDNEIAAMMGMWIYQER